MSVTGAVIGLASMSTADRLTTSLLNVLFDDDRWNSSRKIEE